MAAKRIDPRQAHEDMESGALLVCAYDDPDKFEQYRLDGALSLAEFRSQLNVIPKNEEIIFYCA
jgi:hypothetical protein